MSLEFSRKPYILVVADNFLGARYKSHDSQKAMDFTYLQLHKIPEFQWEWFVYHK